jgi:hypothetical protein
MRVVSSLRSIVGMGLVGALALCAASCASAPAPTQPASWSAKSDRYLVAYEIAAARCDRQTPECERRAGVEYASRDACIAAKLPPSAAEADLDLCASYPLRQHDLEQCVAEIRGGQCGTGLVGATACRGKNLCPWDSFAR